MANWYPPPSGNNIVDIAFRQAFDAIYSLQAAPTTGTSALSPSGPGVLIESTSGKLSSLVGKLGQALLSGGSGADAGFGQVQSLSAVASPALVLTTSFVDVQGNGPGGLCAVTLTRTGRYLVLVNADVLFTFDAGGVQVQLVVGSSAQAEVISTAVSGVAAGQWEQSAAHLWFVDNTSQNVAKIQGKKTAGAGTGNIFGSNTSIKAWFLG